MSRKRVLIYSKASGCYKCEVLKRILPKVKESNQDIEFVEFKYNNNLSHDDMLASGLPSTIISFPTSVLMEGDDTLGTIIGAENYTQEISRIFAST